MTAAHKSARSSGLECAKRKIEVSGSAQIVAELEQASYTVSMLSNCAKTDAKISSIYHPLFCMEFNDRVGAKLKLYPITLNVVSPTEQTPALTEVRNSIVCGIVITRGAAIKYCMHITHYYMPLKLVRLN